MNVVIRMTKNAFTLCVCVYCIYNFSGPCVFVCVGASVYFYVCASVSVGLNV